MIKISYSEQKLWNSLTEEQRSLLKKGERLADLYRCGLKLIQQPRYFCIGSDSVLLADFVSIKPGEAVLEAGSGNGGLLLLLYAKEPLAEYTGVEVMPKCADLAIRNMKLNALAEKIKIVTADFRDFARQNLQVYDKIVCNPPYFPEKNCRLSSVAERAAARFELNGNLEEFFAAAKKALKENGSFYLVIPSERLPETKEIAEKYGFFCRRYRPILSADGNEVLLYLWEFVINPVLIDCETCLPALNIRSADEICQQKKF